MCLCWGHTQILQQITRVIRLQGVAFQTERTTLRMSNISNSYVTPCYASSPSAAAASPADFIMPKWQMAKWQIISQPKQRQLRHL